MTGSARALVLAGAIVVAAACGRGGGKNAAAAGGPEVYVTALAGLRSIEDQANAALAAVTGPKYVDDEHLLAALRTDVVPRWDELAAGLALITPPPPAAAAHARFVAAVKAEGASLKKIADALEHGDGVAVTLGNVEHRAARAELDAVAGELATALATTPPR